MLSGYSTYLLNIRNNLIQCGVEVPVTPIQDYFDICMLESELDDILWFYRVLAVSGSEYALSDFFLPLNGYFREKMRSIYYQEFLDFLQDYKTIGVEELRSKYISSGGGAYKNISKDETEDIPVSEEEELSFGSEEQDDEVIDWDDDNWEDDDDIGSGDPDSDSVEDIQWDDEEEEDEDEESIFSEEEENDSPFGDNSYDFEKYSPHGVYIEDLILEDSKKSEESDFSDEDSDEDGLGGYYDEEESDEDGLGGYEEDDEEESSDEDGLGGYYEEESDEDGLGGYYEEDDYSDEDGLGGYEEDDYSDEDGLGGYQQNDDEDFSDEDGLGGYYDDEEDDQDGLGGYEDDEEDYSDQDGLGSYDEEDYSDQDGLGGYDSSEDEEPLEAVVPDTPAQSKETPKPNTPPPRDLSDALQDFINGSLTSARRSIRSLKNRKK